MFFAENNGIKICYEVIEKIEGDYLILHSGLGSYKEAWKELSYVEELQKYFKLILIDPRGHGGSDKPRDLKKYQFYLMAEDVKAVIDDMNISKVHFFGYSLGGIIGWHIVKNYPEILITLVAGGSKLNNTLPTNPFLRLEFMQEEEVQNKDFMFDENIEYILPEIQIPVFTFVGDKDQSCYPFVVEYSKKIPNCETHVLPGLNHPEAAINKDMILPKIITFLKKNSLQNV